MGHHPLELDGSPVIRELLPIWWIPAAGVTFGLVSFTASFALGDTPTRAVLDGLGFALLFMLAAGIQRIFAPTCSVCGRKLKTLNTPPAPRSASQYCPECADRELAGQ